MITVKRIVTTLDGKTIELQRGGPQIWQVEIHIAPIDEETGYVGSKTALRLVHVTRETLERAGLLQRHEIPRDAPVETLEDLARRLLEHLGVKFEE